MWYTVEYYSAIKNKDIMNFAGKWMELEKIILSEVTDPKGHSWYILTFKWILGTKYRVPTLQSTGTKKLNKKVKGNIETLIGVPCSLAGA